MALEITLRNWSETHQEYMTLVHSGDNLEVSETNDIRILDEVLDLLAEAGWRSESSGLYGTSADLHRALIVLFTEQYDTLTDEVQDMTRRLIREILSRVKIESEKFDSNGSVALSATIGDKKVLLERTFSFNRVGHKLT